LDVTSLCRCARVSRYWKLVALDGSNWQHVDLFSFQTDIEVENLVCCSVSYDSVLRRDDTYFDWLKFWNLAHFIM